jgi:hypothetical protein
MKTKSHCTTWYDKSKTNEQKRVSYSIGYCTKISSHKMKEKNERNRQIYNSFAMFMINAS